MGQNRPPPGPRHASPGRRVVVRGDAPARTDAARIGSHQDVAPRGRRRRTPGPGVARAGRWCRTPRQLRLACLCFFFAATWRPYQRCCARVASATAAPCLAPRRLTSSCILGFTVRRQAKLGGWRRGSRARTAGRASGVAAGAARVSAGLGHGGRHLFRL